jgi:two-component system, OmpR family, response regulator ChvI
MMSRPSGTATRRLIRLVLVDDDDDYREALSRDLTDEGCMVTAFATGQQALAYLLSTDVADLCVLDWRMPEMSGIDVLRELRRRRVMIPVIFLTGVRDDGACEEEALRDGAVDFVSKSRRISVLTKRIDLITEGQRPAVPQAEPTQFSCGPLALDMDAHRATWYGRAVDLTPAEFRILGHLARQPGIDVSFRELYDLVHGQNFRAGVGKEGYRANVRSFIKRIRNKFRALDSEFDRIQSYPRFGYRWSTT